MRAISMNIKKTATMFDLSLDTFHTVFNNGNITVPDWNTQDNVGHVITMKSYVSANVATIQLQS